jgi:ribosomal protein S18 acetylase RimI-like enzyme
LASASDAVARVLTRAFADDPFWDYVTPDQELRRAQLEAWFPVGVRYGRVYGTIDTEGDGEVVGAALWLPPDKHEMTFWRMLRTGMLRTRRIFGPECFNRMNGAGHALDSSRSRLMPPDAEYLWILGVDPAHHGRGHGGSTIGIGLQRTDAKGKAVYLETYKERNLAFYAHHGFEVLTAEKPPEGPPFWTLLRPARRAASGTSAAMS